MNEDLILPCLSMGLAVLSMVLNLLTWRQIRANERAASEAFRPRPAPPTTGSAINPPRVIRGARW